MKSFGEILANLRKERNMSQRELAEELNLSHSAIGMYENDNRKPNYEILELIADYFNVDMNYLHGKTSVRNSIKFMSEKNQTDTPKIVKGINLSEAQFALYSKTDDLTDEELEDVANYINFLKSKRDK